MADCTTTEAPQAPAQPIRTEGSVAHLWRVHTDLMAISEDSSLSDDLWDDLTDQAGEVEKAVLNGPINNTADAIAKLEAVLPSFESGERSDGADAEALAGAIEWLKGLRSPTEAPDAEAVHFLQLEAQARFWCETGNSGRCPTDEALDVAIDQMNAFEHLILDTPASTLTAARVQVSVLARWAKDFRSDERDLAGLNAVLETLKKAGAM